MSQKAKEDLDFENSLMDDTLKAVSIDYAKILRNSHVNDMLRAKDPRVHGVIRDIFPEVMRRKNFELCQDWKWGTYYAETRQRRLECLRAKIYPFAIFCLMENNFPALTVHGQMLTIQQIYETIQDNHRTRSTPEHYLLLLVKLIKKIFKGPSPKWDLDTSWVDKPLHYLFFAIECIDSVRNPLDLLGLCKSTGDNDNLLIASEKEKFFGVSVNWLAKTFKVYPLANQSVKWLKSNVQIGVNHSPEHLAFVHCSARNHHSFLALMSKIIIDSPSARRPFRLETLASVQPMRRDCVVPLITSCLLRKEREKLSKYVKREQRYQGNEPEIIALDANRFQMSYATEGCEPRCTVLNDLKSAILAK